MESIFIPMLPIMYRIMLSPGNATMEEQVRTCSTVAQCTSKEPRHNSQWLTVVVILKVRRSLIVSCASHHPI